LASAEVPLGLVPIKFPSITSFATAPRPVNDAISARRRAMPPTLFPEI
jgi:hypothetical protein